MKKMISLAVFFVFFLAGIAQAETFSNAFGIAAQNIPPGADIAGMGNAWVATPNFSSMNPAVAATSTGKFGGSYNYTHIGFSEGPSVSNHIGSVQGNFPIGAIQVSFSDSGSDLGVTKMGVDMELESSPLLEVQWGMAVTENLYVGLSGSTYESNLKFSMEGFDMVQSDTEGNAWGIGALYKITPELRIGAYYSEARDKNSDYYPDFDWRDDYILRSDVMRIGASWQVFEGTMITIDYQHMDLDGAQKDQVFAGIEQKLGFDWLYGYAGWAGDAPTAGLGVYAKNGGFVLAYMHEPFDELEDHLGEAEVVTAMLYFNF